MRGSFFLPPCSNINNPVAYLANRFGPSLHKRTTLREQPLDKNSYHWVISPFEHPWAHVGVCVLKHEVCEPVIGHGYMLLPYLLTRPTYALASSSLVSVLALTSVDHELDQISPCSSLIGFKSMDQASSYRPAL